MLSNGNTSELKNRNQREKRLADQADIESTLKPRKK